MGIDRCNVDPLLRRPCIHVNAPSGLVPGPSCGTACPAHSAVKVTLFSKPQKPSKHIKISLDSCKHCNMALPERLIDVLPEAKRQKPMEVLSLGFSRTGNRIDP